MTVLPCELVGELCSLCDAVGARLDVLPCLVWEHGWVCSLCVPFGVHQEHCWLCSLCCCRGALLVVLPYAEDGSAVGCAPLECTRECCWLCSLVPRMHQEHGWLCSLCWCRGAVLPWSAPGALLAVLPFAEDTVGARLDVLPCLVWEHCWVAPSILPCSVPAVQRDVWEIWRMGKLDS